MNNKSATLMSLYCVIVGANILNICKLIERSKREDDFFHISTSFNIDRLS